MYTIEIDFDVFKHLMMMRESETTTYNDVLRALLKLPAAAMPTERGGQHNLVTQGAEQHGLRVDGILFPEGTEFRKKFRGEEYTGVVDSGFLVVGDKRYETPSKAASDIAGYPVNGWLFWQCKLPGSTTWRRIQELRKESQRGAQP